MNFINAIKGETNNFLLGMQTAFTIIQIYGYIDPYKSQGHKVKRKLKSVLQNNQCHKVKVKKKLWKIPYPRGGGSARVNFHLQFFFGSKLLKIQF